MTAINKTDQAYAESNAALDRVVTSIRESLERKRQRHGEKFDQAQAMTDYLRRVNKMPATVKTILLATALQRLATDEDPFAEIADLDFEINVKNINDPEEDPS